MHPSYALQLLIILSIVTHVVSNLSVCDKFECDSDKCLAFSSVCDGVSDCIDGADEGLQCRTATLECVAKHEYLCDNGQCILSTLRCDGSSDCIDGSDELHCDADYEEPFCKEFTCDSGQRCVPLKYLCDGHQQCADGTDENGLHCSILTSDCSGTDEFLCSNGHCIPSMFRCDGSSDCVDNSDELGCQPGIPPIDCSDTGGFQCLNGHCLPAMFRCDGASDCLDKSDEQGCWEKPPVSNFVTTTTKPTYFGKTSQFYPTTKPTLKTIKIKSTTSNRIDLTTKIKKTQKPTTRSSVKSTLGNNLPTTRRSTSRTMHTTEFNVIYNQRMSTERISNKGDTNDFYSRRTSHHMRNIYGVTAIVLTIGTISFIAFVVIRKRILVKKSSTTILKTTVHYVNPYYGTS